MTLLKTLCSSCRAGEAAFGGEAVAKPAHVVHQKKPRAAAAHPNAGFASCYRFVVALVLALGFTSLAQAFDLQQLSDQLAKPCLLYTSDAADE